MRVLLFRYLLVFAVICRRFRHNNKLGGIGSLRVSEGVSYEQRECFSDFGYAHVGRVPSRVKAHVVVYDAEVGLFSMVAVVFEPHNLSHFRIKFFRGSD